MAALITSLKVMPLKVSFNFPNFNFLAIGANLQRTQLNSYCKNNIKRPDLDVLARICYALNCELSDIIRYVHPNERNGEKGNG